MGQPAWRRTFDRVERAVGRPLEDAVASQRYVDVLVLGIKAQARINREARKLVDRQVGAVLHLVNMPTRRDVRTLSRQVATLTSEVRALAAQADDLVAERERARAGGGRRDDA